MKASFLTNESHVEFNTNQDCVTDRTEMDYLGFKSRTTKGVKCHCWDELSEMTGSHISIHENYCRNFNNEIVPCASRKTLENFNTAIFLYAANVRIFIFMFFYLNLMELFSWMNLIVHCTVVNSVHILFLNDCLYWHKIILVFTHYFIMGP